MPSIIFIGKGKHKTIETFQTNCTTVNVNFPISIIGVAANARAAGQKKKNKKKTTLEFGVWIKGKKNEGPVVMEDVTINGAQGVGLWADSGMNVIMRKCTIVNCKKTGVFAYKANITCDNLQVVGCGDSGVCAYFATITLSGQGTSIQGNGTKGESSCYGLSTCSHSSQIQLVHPLTKEKISINNGGGGNWGGDGIIKHVATVSFN